MNVPQSHFPLKQQYSVASECTHCNKQPLLMIISCITVANAIGFSDPAVSFIITRGDKTALTSQASGKQTGLCMWKHYQMQFGKHRTAFLLPFNLAGIMPIIQSL